LPSTAVIPGLRLADRWRWAPGRATFFCAVFASNWGIDRKVIFTGLLPRHQLVHCYASADLFVFPSVTETQGLVIAEAKAAGLPVVAITAFGAAEDGRAR